MKMKIISGKSIFASLVFVLIMSFIVNNLFYNNSSLDSDIKSKNRSKKQEKIIGVEIRQQNQNDRRSGREQSLESKKSRPQDFDVNLKSNKKGKGFGGFLGGIFKAILMGLGFSIAQSLPRLIKIGKLINFI